MFTASGLTDLSSVGTAASVKVYVFPEEFPGEHDTEALTRVVRLTKASINVRRI